MSLKVLIIDGHPLVHTGAAAALATLSPGSRVLSATTAQEGLAALAGNSDVDLVIVDPAVSGQSGLTLIRRIRARYESLAIIVLSALESSADVRIALESGATAFVPKSAPTPALLERIEQVVDAARTVPMMIQREGTEWKNVPAPGARVEAERDIHSTVITQRQREVLSCVCVGKTNRQTAEELGLAEKTVKSHMTSLLNLFGVANRTQLALAARRVGLVAD